MLHEMKIDCLEGMQTVRRCLSIIGARVVVDIPTRGCYNWPRLIKFEAMRPVLSGEFGQDLASVD